METTMTAGERKLQWRERISDHERSTIDTTTPIPGSPLVCGKLGLILGVFSFQDFARDCLRRPISAFQDFTFQDFGRESGHERQTPLTIPALRPAGYAVE